MFLSLLWLSLGAWLYLSAAIIAKVHALFIGALKVSINSKTNCMMPNESAAEEFIQIKKMIGCLKTSDIETDKYVFFDLLIKLHPNGTPFLEDVKYLSEGSFKYKLPAVVPEFQRILKEKYNDRLLEIAIFTRILMEFIPDFKPAVNFINGE